MLNRIFGLLIFIMAMALAYLTYDQFREEVDWQTASPAKRISLMVEEDFKNLARARSLPIEWTRISKVTYIMNSSVTTALMADERPRLLVTNDKKKATSDTSKKEDQDEFEAEIEVIDVPDEKAPGFIFQLSLINLKTKNKIFEIGRTYYFGNLNKKKPD